MGYVCLLDVQCSDGEIQVVVGSRTAGVVENLRQAPTTVPDHKTLQVKIDELFKFLGLSETEICEVITSEADLLEGNENAGYDAVQTPGVTAEHTNIPLTCESFIGDDLVVCDGSQDDIIYESIVVDSVHDHITNKVTVIKTEVQDEYQLDVHRDERIETELARWKTETDIENPDINNYDNDDDYIRFNHNAGNSDNFTLIESDLEGIITDKLPKVARKRRTRSKDNILEILQPQYAAPGQEMKFLKSIAHEEPFRCAVCDQRFSEGTDLRTHVTETHEANKNDEVLGCKYCNKSYASLGSLNKHFGYHKRPYKCSHCGKDYSDISNLKRHLLYVKGMFTCICSICGMQFVNDHELKSHMVRHSSVLSHQCMECGKLFGRRFQLNRHLTTHNSTRDFICDECGKGFHNVVNLRTHVKTHDAGRERTYECLGCKKSYFSNNALQQHQKAAHPNTEPVETRFLVVLAPGDG